MSSQTMRRRERDEDARGSECTINGYRGGGVLMKNHGDVCVCVYVYFSFQNDGEDEANAQCLEMSPSFFSFV